VRGLTEVGVDSTEAQTVMEPFRLRVARGVTGASWQRDHLAEFRRRMSRREALEAMLALYQECADSGRPLHLWPTPDG
jgi:hypothetical protein